MIDLEYLQTVPILRLQATARKAGLAFRNGDLNKQGIISRLAQHPMIGGATVSMLKREDGLPQNGPAPRPATVSDWLDDDPIAPSPAPAPVTIPQSGEFFGDWRPAVNALAGAVKDMHQRHTRRLDDAERLLNVQARVLDELKNARPVVIQVGSAPDAARVSFGDQLTHARLPLLIQVLLAGEQAYLVGPAGSGKTTAAEQARKVLAEYFKRDDYKCLAIGAVMDSFALIGYKNANGELVRTAFRDAVEFGHLMLWDETDGSAADAQLVVNALDNGFIAFPDRTVNVHPHFRLICGGNTDGSGATMEYSGRSRMDGAFRDRFAIIDWELDPRIETRLSRGDSQWLVAVRAVRAFATARELQDVLATARAVRRGPAFLAQGMPRAQVLETTCKRGALRECWADVLRLPEVASFLKG